MDSHAEHGSNPIRDFTEAIKSGDETRIVEAREHFYRSVGESIVEQCEREGIAMDSPQVMDFMAEAMKEYRAGMAGLEHFLRTLSRTPEDEDHATGRENPVE